MLNFVNDFRAPKGGLAKLKQNAEHLKQFAADNLFKNVGYLK